MTPDYTTIYYKMYALNGETIAGESDSFEEMILSYRKRLKARSKVDRVQRGTLKYRFPHTDYVSY